MLTIILISASLNFSLFQQQWLSNASGNCHPEVSLFLVLQNYLTQGKCVPLYLECVFVSHSLTILFADAFLLFLHMLLVRALYANYYIDFCIIKFFFISTTMAIECQRKLSPRSLPFSGTAKLSYSRQQMRADIIDKGVATNTEATINIKPTNLSAWDQYDSG